MNTHQADFTITGTVQAVPTHEEGQSHLWSKELLEIRLKRFIKEALDGITYLDVKISVNLTDTNRRDWDTDKPAVRLTL